MWLYVVCVCLPETHLKISNNNNNNNTDDDVDDDFRFLLFNPYLFLLVGWLTTGLNPLFYCSVCALVPNHY